MKTLIVSSMGDIWQPSGTTSTVVGIARCLGKHGDVILLLPHAKKEKTNDETLRNFTKVYSFSGSHLPVDISPFFMLRLREVVKVEKPDLVLVYFLKGILFHSISIPGRSKLVYIANIFEAEFARTLISKTLACWLEKIACTKSDHVLSVSQEDKKKLCGAYRIPESKVTVIQPGKEDLLNMAKRDKTEARGRLGLQENAQIALFHGTMAHRPNREAVERIQNGIAPLVQHKCPQLRFVLAGVDMPAFTNANVISVGFQEDLVALLDLADFGVVPLSIGGGVRVKIMDYWSRGLPVVATREAMEGLDFVNGREAILASSDDEFAERIIDLVRDSSKLKRMSNWAHSYSESHFSMQVLDEALTSVLRKLSIKE